MMSIKDLKVGDKIKITENGNGMTSLFQMRILLNAHHLIGKVLTVKEVNIAPSGIYYCTVLGSNYCIYDEMILWHLFHDINSDSTLCDIYSKIMVGDEIIFNGGIGDVFLKFSYARIIDGEYYICHASGRREKYSNLIEHRYKNVLRGGK